jgi:hypothetical protein
MLENAAHFTAHGIALTFAQVLDLLGDMLAVEAVVAGR